MMLFAAVSTALALNRQELQAAAAADAEAAKLFGVADLLEDHTFQLISYLMFSFLSVACVWSFFEADEEEEELRKSL